MEIKYSVTGQDRKRLVGAISQELNQPMKYLGAPTFAYEVGGYRIDKEGTVTGADDAELVEALREAGFDSAGKIILDRHRVDEPSDAEVDPFDGEAEFEEEDATEHRTYQAEISDPDCPDRMEVFGADDDLDAYRQAMEFCTNDGIVLLELFELDDDYNVIRGIDTAPLAEEAHSLTVEVPLEGFTPEALDNLTKMVLSKEALLKKALGADSLPIRMAAETLQFPWFTLADPADAAYYVQFVYALCKTAKEKKRVTAKPAQTGNEKFSLRVWLISLGMVGDEYKRARALLLKNMSGNSSFKDERSKERWDAKHSKQEVAVNE